MSIIDEICALKNERDKLAGRVSGLILANNDYVEFNRGLKRELQEGDTALRECNARFERLRAAVRALYIAGCWSLPTEPGGVSPEYQAGLWAKVRDEAQLPHGLAPTPAPAAPTYVFGPWVTPETGAPGFGIAPAFTTLGEFQVGATLSDFTSLVYQARTSRLPCRDTRYRQAFRVGEWYSWDGGDCPLPVGTRFEVKNKFGEAVSKPHTAGETLTAWSGPNHVTAFRILPEPEKAETAEPSEWGPDIPVDGRPDWLADDDKVQWAKDGVRFKYSTEAGKLNWGPFFGKHGGQPVDTIRLRANYWAYLPISLGLEPWAGADEAPADWDGGLVLLKNGELGHGVDWGRDTPAPMGYDGDADIIGYTKLKTEAKAA